MEKSKETSKKHKKPIPLREEKDEKEEEFPSIYGSDIEEDYTKKIPAERIEIKRRNLPYFFEINQQKTPNSKNVKKRCLKKGSNNGNKEKYIHTSLQKKLH